MTVDEIQEGFAALRREYQSEVRTIGKEAADAHPGDAGERLARIAKAVRSSPWTTEPHRAAVVVLVSPAVAAPAAEAEILKAPLSRVLSLAACVALCADACTYADNHALRRAREARQLEARGTP